ncbi:hypothetical protein LPB86_07465 [Pedobacter sp. MC2016-14]|uniref:hypothetical protein n=1 Tax=Pedobacter sp. MC2016-14 TaxID=2897327 RepID=UPI001E4E4A4B|nr:hypothetical protein [Pedobacter sp. MC2016-14]MCD0488062.1 hypothetical protein [Pedobacter sp. MC2016-14]
MKKVILLSVFNLFIFTAFAQKSVVLAAFSKYGIDTSILSPKAKARPENYSFDYKYTTIAGNKETVTVAKFDPSKPENQHWTVISVKGKAPSAGDVKTFLKNHGKSPTLVKTDNQTYRIDQETKDLLVISYKQDPASLTADASFMKDCRLYMTINIKTKRLEKLQSLNEKPLKIKIFNAEKLDLVVKYQYDDNQQRYFPISEDLNLMVKFLGQLSPMETISEYSNYKKM